MGLILLNLQSNHEIYLDKDSPFVIGRGNLTGCADKRVSRSHGKITCTTDGKVNLQALHTNPCFFTRNGTPPVRQLNKNEEEVLNEGDCIGLLPNSYWYQITSKSRVRDRKSNNLSFKSSQRSAPKTDVPPKVEVIDMEENGQKSPTPRNNENNTPGENVCNEIAGPFCSAESSDIIIPPELKNTCKLPLHMYAIKGQNLSKSRVKESKNCTTTKGPDITEIKHSLGTASTSHELNCGTASNPTAESTDNVISKDPDEKEGCQDDSKDSGNASHGLNAGIASNSTAESTDDVLNKCPDEKEGCQDDSKYNASNASILKPGRPYCRYDSSCYRKNVQHKLEYCHPGDEDYIPYENRPLCEYGANCYRRNLAHRRQFRHVTIEDPQTSQASVTSTAAGPTPSASSNLSSAENRVRPRGHHKGKRHSDKDRPSRSCHLSVTVSASPKQKRRRNSQTGSANRSSFSSELSYEDLPSSPDPYSDDYYSDLTSEGTEDDFEKFQLYERDYTRDY